MSASVTELPSRKSFFAASKLTIALVALVSVILALAFALIAFCSAGYCTHKSSKNNLPRGSISYDVRVSPAFATREGTQVRLTVIGNASETPPEGFAENFMYAKPFQYRWSQFALYTKLVAVNPGDNVIDVGGLFDITVRVPSTTDRVRGILVGDPCTSSKFVKCKYGLEFENRLSRIFNLLGVTNAVDFYAILGDNFYDRDGTITHDFFSSLNMSIKSKFFLTVPGNHDYWVRSDPGEQFLDQYGHGFMQYYGQDVMASVGQFPYNFSVNPDTVDPAHNPDARLAPFDNFFFYNRIGSVGTIGFSGGHYWEDLRPHLIDACNHFLQTNTPWVLLLGHWDENRNGVKPNMTVEDVHKQMLELPSCSTLGDHRLKFFEGHRHCNRVIKANVGFMVGAFGMSRCGDFGVPYLEASATDIELTYFPVKVNNKNKQSFEALMTCFANKGIQNCKSMGSTWLKDAINTTTT